MCHQVGQRGEKWEVLKKLDYVEMCVIHRGFANTNGGFIRYRK